MQKYGTGHGSHDEIAKMNKNKHLILKTGLIASGLSCFMTSLSQIQTHPNVIIIITDDQGYGDLGVTGNPHVKTPAIDNFARENIRFNNFYVSPVSAPTRSSLMTGRYSLRTGVKDTNNGGAIMAAEEITIAEMLKQAGYTTGIFGKWHLGDNFPSRPCDQGFDESVIHLGGGMGQPGDLTTWGRRDSSYFDPILWHNGKQEKYKGYCSDIFGSNAVAFIEKNRNRPFFCYLAFNAPHTPLQVPAKYYNMYKDIDPSKGFENDERPFPVMTDKNREDARKVYAMVTNIDDNVSRLLKRLDDLKLRDNTLVIFMTDNGPEQPRYVAGMRGNKTEVYRGGVRVPFFMRYPPLGKTNTDIEANTAHIDILPTISEICNVNLPNDRIIDGESMLPLIAGEKPSQPERTLFFYWTRRAAELYNNIALQKGNFRLVAHAGYDASIDDFELFDIAKDPYEQSDILAGNRDLALSMKDDLDKRINDLARSPNLVDPPSIEIGSRHENPVILNRNDAGGSWGVWEQEEIYGSWHVRIREGFYNIRIKFINPVPAGGRMVLETRQLISQSHNSAGETDLIEMKNLFLPEMSCDIIPYYQAGSKRIFPLWIEVSRIEAGNGFN